jgi:hypothetical protein
MMATLAMSAASGLNFPADKLSIPTLLIARPDLSSLPALFRSLLLISRSGRANDWRGRPRLNAWIWKSVKSSCVPPSHIYDHDQDWHTRNQRHDSEGGKRRDVF